MKKLLLAAGFLWTASLAGAQEVKLLEDVPAQPGQADAAPQVIPPSEPAPVSKPAPAAKPEKKPEAKKPPLKVSPLKKALAPAPAPAEAAAAAKPAVKPAAKPAAKPEAKPAAKPAAKPEAKPAAKPAEPAPAAKAGFTVGKTHTVVDGDTLWDLSGKYYHDPFKWGRIYNANLGVVSDPDRIYPKEELVIPDVTEEVKPGVGAPAPMGESDTVKEPELTGTEVPQPAAEPAVPAPAAPASAKAQADELDSLYDSTDLSEEMPKDQKEWSSSVKLVPDGWREDGVVSAKEKNDDDSMPGSISVAGETLRLSMRSEGLVKPGDYLYVYLKGAEAHGKDGARLGLELQPAGVLEVLDTDGASARARVVSAVTGIVRGYVVKKK
ncbi:MAG: LysM peptidoglycan-binding domain-containing protein [Elusimicrobia bacterium]|nr:LysM peptidoglycan-binding domain-containing protein [Elusimicrobiota bacterium]